MKQKAEAMEFPDWLTTGQTISERRDVTAEPRH
jgi:hypothetical protein